MADHINAKEYNLWDLMSGEFIFNVPDYQRPYSWTENEALTLLDDLFDFWQKNNNSPDQTYFTGSIVLVKQTGSPESEVIDGQQRLTTISILLAALLPHCYKIGNDVRKCLWEEGIQHKHIEGRSRLTLRKRDEDFFVKYIAQADIGHLVEQDPKKMDDDAQRLLWANTKHIIEKINELFRENEYKDVDSFITTLFNQCFFVVVTTPDNESAFRVFSVLNNRGLSLLPSDIIKAYIIGEIDEDKRHYYTDKWENVEVSLGREAFNALLSHIRMIYAKHKLQNTLVKEFEKYVFKNITDKEDIISDVIEPYAKAYKSIINRNYSASSGAEIVNENLYWLNRIDDSDWIPVVMYIMANGHDDAYVQQFIHLTERLASFLYITSQTSNKRIERYSKALSCLQSGDYNGALNILDLNNEEINTFIEVLEGDIYLLPARKRSYVVLRLDRFISDKAAIYQTNILSIEHVLPQNPKADSKWLHDWSDEKTREYWLHKIANLIPLTRKKNSQAQNYDFLIKKEKYFCDKKGITTYALATDVIAEKTWTPSVVTERQKRLIAIFSKHWDLIIPENNTKKKESESNEDISINESTELLRQQKLLKELNKYFVTNPSTKLPRLPEISLYPRAGEYVRVAFLALCNSDFKISNNWIEKMCSVEGSKIYTRRNLPFLIPKDYSDIPDKTLQRYWKTDNYIPLINGKKYYVYSQWYPDNKASSDAHKSDFIQLYLDLALFKE